MLVERDAKPGFAWLQLHNCLARTSSPSWALCSCKDDGRHLCTCARSLTRCGARRTGMLLQSSDASKCILLRSTSRAGSLFEFYGSHCNLLVWMELVVLPSCAMESAPKRRTAPRDAFHGRLSTWWLFPTVACFHAIGWRSTCGCKDETCAPIAAMPAATRRSVPPSVRPAIAFNPLFLDTFREAIDDLVPSSRSRAVAPVVRARPDVRIQTGAPGRPRRPTVLPRPFPASFPLLFPLRTHAPRRPPPPPSVFGLRPSLNSPLDSPTSLGFTSS